MPVSAGFARELVIEIAVLAILAISLDMVAGYGGMVSLCHGAIMGVAAYAYGILTVNYRRRRRRATIVAAATFGGLVGWITARTSGIFFIGDPGLGQMVYT